MTVGGAAHAESPVDLRALDWDFEDAVTTAGTHAVHPYPAKFIPQIPERVVRLFSGRGDLVLDPFSGSGTTGVVAREAGRQFVGLDANPVAVLMGRVKTTPLTAAELDHAVEAALDGVESKPRGWEALVPPIPNLSKWFAQVVVEELASICRLIGRQESPGVRDVLSLALSRTVGVVSFQDSETRYVSKPRSVRQGEATAAFQAAVRDVAEAVATIPAERPPATFVLGDARDGSLWRGGGLDTQEAALVVTSPPYPNVYDYHLYHRFRMFWLGHDPADLRRVEVGSHLTNQRLDDPVGQYEKGISAVLGSCAAALRPGGHAVFVVGDGVHDGEVYRTADRLEALAWAAGFESVAVVDRSLPSRRRSVTQPGRRLAVEQIVILRRMGGPDGEMKLLPPAYERHDYEIELASLEARELLRPESVRTQPDGSIVVSRPSRPEAAGRLTFAGGWETAGGYGRTVQASIEGTGRKNSTYASHGLHSYRGKFYPQLARTLLNLSDLDAGMAVIDPFGGSGTTALEASLLGFDAVSVDWNPLADRITRAKAAAVRVGSEAVKEAAAPWLLAALKTERVRWEQFPDPVHEELRSWFPRPVLARLSAVLEAVRECSPDLKLVGEVLVSDVVRRVSQQEPRDLRIRRRSEPIDDADVRGLLLKGIEKLGAGLSELERVLPPPRLTGDVLSIRADMASADGVAELAGREFDALVTSPPYATALPYLDTDRLSLALVLGLPSGDRRALEEDLVGSREFRAATFRSLDERLASGDVGDDLPRSTISFLTSLREGVARDPDAGFRRRQKPAALLRYFECMAAALRNSRSVMSAGASAWLVVGDSRTKVQGEYVRIPTTDELASIAKHVGFEMEQRIPITVTRDGLVHARNRITENAIIHLRA